MDRLRSSMGRLPAWSTEASPAANGIPLQSRRELGTGAPAAQTTADLSNAEFLIWQARGAEEESTRRSRLIPVRKRGPTVRARSDPSASNPWDRHYRAVSALSTDNKKRLHMLV